MKKLERGNCLNCSSLLHRPDIRYCNVKCQMDKVHKDYIKRWKAGLESGISGKQGTSAHIRRFLFEKYNSKCQECTWNKMNPFTGKIPLTIEHVDGNWENNKEENLKLICPNCHSLTGTYGALNKGKGRKSRYVTLT